MTDDLAPAVPADANDPEDGGASAVLWVALLVAVALPAALCVVLALLGWRVGAVPPG